MYTIIFNIIYIRFLRFTWLDKLRDQATSYNTMMKEQRYQLVSHTKMALSVKRFDFGEVVVGFGSGSVLRVLIIADVSCGGFAVSLFFFCSRESRVCRGVESRESRARLF